MIIQLFFVLLYFCEYFAWGQTFINVFLSSGDAPIYCDPSSTHSLYLGEKVTRIDVKNI